MPKTATIQRRRALHQTATRVLQRRYGEPDLDLGDVAEEVGCSPRQLQRVFREEAATDFRSSLLAIRMKRARYLLSRESNPLPIRRVAPLVGYRQPSGLRQAFLRYWGINPSVVQPRPPQYLGTTTFDTKD